MKKIISLAVASVCLHGMNAAAHVPEAEWRKFKAEFEAMSQRVQALESENRQLRADSRSLATSGIKVEDLTALRSDVDRLNTRSDESSWAEKVSWKGDFRYRYEDIEEDGKSDRNRNRIRARAALIAKPTSDIEVGLGLASGGDDPVSTNQTLGGGGSTKDIRLDLGYAKWTGIENVYLTAGKFSNSFYRPQKSGLIWDGDYRPEGFAAGWADDMFFANAAYGFIESDSKNDEEAFWGLQVGAKWPLGESIKLTAAAKYLDIPVEGRGPIYDGDFFGNSTAVAGGEDVYANDFEIVNVSLELALTLGDMPMSIYGDYINNNDADDYETGYIAGIKLGKAKNKGSWQVQYQYQNLEADATLGLFTDSDFAGGGTDGEGHKLSAKYAIDKKWTIGATYFDNSTGVDLGSDADYQRLQVDTVFKY